MNSFMVLKRPVLSEKSNSLREDLELYTFEIDRKATKLDVKRAVEKAFSVNVVDVNTFIKRGKYRRRGMHYALSQSTKRAIVKLSKGQKLSLFEDH